MTIELIEYFKRLIPIRDQWNALLQHNDTNTVFQTFEWHLSWWNTYGSNCRLQTILVWDKDQLVGIAPFAMIHFGMYRNLLEFIGEGRSDYCDFIIPGNKKEILILILDYLHSGELPWNTLHLNQVPEYSSTRGIVENYCRKNKRKYLLKRRIDCPTILLEDMEHVNSILQKKTLRRRYNYFSKIGNLSLTQVGYAETPENLDKFFNQHIERVRLKDMKSLFQNEQSRTFYRELVTQLAPKKWLFFSRLDFDDAPLAYHFGFVYNDVLVWYKPSFNVAHQKQSPGIVLLKYLIEYAMENKLKEFDFTVGKEGFKSRFANRVRQNYQIEIYNDYLIYIYSLSKEIILRIFRRIE